MSNMSYEVVEYLTDDGGSPFDIWLKSLKDVRGRALIRKRINRLRLGHLGDSHQVGDGVKDLPVYFARK